MSLASGPQPPASAASASASPSTSPTPSTGSPPPTSPTPRAPTQESPTTARTPPSPTSTTTTPPCPPTSPSPSRTTPWAAPPPTAWKLHYFNRVKDLLDQHQPDLLYTDGGISFEEYGLATVAELYNVGPYSYQDKSEAIYFSKTPTDCPDATSCVIDHERSVLNQIDPNPWQTDTCIGEWHYKLGASYKTPKKVIDMLVDIVSKNGNLLLNIPLPASGMPDPEELRILEAITQWTSINGEAIYYTRPWKVHGEGPSTKVVIKPNGKEFDPNEGKQPDLTYQDIRFTTKGKTLYALVPGWPPAQPNQPAELLIQSLSTNSPQQPGKPVDIRLLGRDEPLRFTQDTTGLRVTLPSTPTPASNLAVALRINFA